MRVDSQSELNEWILAQIDEIRRERWRRPVSRHASRQEARWQSLRSLLGTTPTDSLEDVDLALTAWLTAELEKPYDWPRAATVRLVINLFRGDVRKSSRHEIVQHLNARKPHAHREKVNVALIALERLAPERERLPFTTTTKRVIREALTYARRQAAWEASQTRE